MDRRVFLQQLGAGALGLSIGAIELSGSEKPEVAITLDDPKVEDYPGYAAAEIDRRLREALHKSKVKCALFVCGMRVDSDAGRTLLQAWNDEGHVLGNHSYSHLYFGGEKVSLDQFESDAQRGEDVVKGYPRFRKIFRFPFFKEGATLEKRDGMRKWLADRGYEIGRATIDASDWAIDSRMKKRLEQDAKADLTPYRDFYLDHMWDRSVYYNALSFEVSSKPVRHTVLLHHSLLNALFISDLIKQYRDKGWRVISAEKAYKDRIYLKQPDILPAGESLIWAMAKQRHMNGLRYPGEDDVYENPEMDKRKL